MSMFSHALRNNMENLDNARAGQPFPSYALFSALCLADRVTVCILRDVASLFLCRFVTGRVITSFPRMQNPHCSPECVGTERKKGSVRSEGVKKERMGEGHSLLISKL